jgi:hypothetical protein
MGLFPEKIEDIEVGIKAKYLNTCALVYIGVSPLDTFASRKSTFLSKVVSFSLRVDSRDLNCEY